MGGKGGFGGIVGSGFNNSGDGFGGPGGAGGSALGAGLYVSGGQIQLSNDRFLNNQATGGMGGMGGDGGLTQSDNNGPGGTGGAGGAAQGGGLYINRGSAVLSNITLQSDVALGGNGNFGGSGGNIIMNGHPGATGLAGPGGTGLGGALYLNSGSIQLTGVTVRSNQASGGSNSSNLGVNSAGTGQGAGLYVGGGNLVLDNSAIFNNSAHGGGSPTAPGFAAGAGLTLSGGSALLYDVDLENNTVIGGGTFSNGSGFAYGGAVGVFGGSLRLVNDTINTNTAQGVGISYGGGVFIGQTDSPPTVTMANTIISGNTASSAPDVYGTVNASDHDLIGNSSGSSGFGAAGSGDLLNVNPGLTPLLANFTQELTAGSPAIGAGDPNAVLSAIDQAGYSRLTNGLVDIGASEYGAVASNGNDLRVTGDTSSLVVPGTQLTYTFTVTNHGHNPQSDVTVADVLPADTTLVSWSTSTSSWVLNGPAAGQTGTVTAWTTSLAAGASATFTLIVAINAQTSIGTTIANTLLVGPVTGDPSPGNNSVTLMSQVHAAPVNISADVSVQAGVITYDSVHNQYDQTLTFTNISSLTLTGPVAVELTGLPSNVTLVNSNGSIGGNFFVTYLPSGHKWLPGQVLTVTLKFTAPSASSISYGMEQMQGI
jgi:uncharacterized repeat protein (TIGR01451 family)